MGSRLRPEHLALYKRIDEILWNCWEPCGTSADPEARDGYYDCLPQVFRMVVAGSSSSTIADYLQKIGQKRTGLAGNAVKYTEIADTIVHERNALGF